MMPSTGQASVPPGFRFHPTDEELLYYYLRKKVSYEAIDLDVIREVDLNKLEPWDLKDKCKIGSGPQNDWYFFSHKDKKYPTGTRTNRATTAGFWKATGRDKAIHLSNSKRIGMRKTLVFYTGRAPHGQKTDWIMHEYRLEDDTTEIQEDGWVVCRVFKKKHIRGFQPTEAAAAGDQQEEEDDRVLHADHPHPMMMMMRGPSLGGIKQGLHQNILHYSHYSGPAYDGHLPQLFSPEAVIPNMNSTEGDNVSGNNEILECSQNLLRLTASSGNILQQQERGPGLSMNSLYGTSSSDWSFLDKLLVSHHHHHGQSDHSKPPSSALFPGVLEGASDSAPPPPRLFPFPYLGCDYSVDLFKFSK
ncbi:NAC domain-containing protein 76-like [Punica granatum]|uniref:NAC domain-containing protein 76-like n=1 Tax=Punica granatum TaxID=22663 RepID=A0A218X839_PUNGR|nr:NAC domain-containing protein 76-like [Punica granatum]XP_031384639.1 NAC domain-containing protein 76-like [Punica granatum]OWM81103.1 hypothetical protein CDL15_Pgr007134 [Punica granatum]